MVSMDKGRSFKRAVKSSFANFIFLALISSFIPSISYALEVSVFGPRVYERFTGPPVVETDTFTSTVPGSSYTLRIFNGGLVDDTYELVSSSVIYFNGQLLVHPSELNQHVSYLEKVVTLQATNEIVVEIRGKPGGALIIDILGEDLNEAPIANNQSITLNEDTTSTITLSASDTNADPVSYQLVTQPANGVLSGTAPNLSYTPNGDFNGADSFTFKANDGVLDSAVATVSINVTAVNDVPVASALSNVNTAEDTATTIVLSGTDVDGDNLSYQVLTQPANGLLSGIAPNLTYTPNSSFNGTDAFTYLVNDGVTNSASVSVLINISAVNDAPVAEVQSLSTSEDIAVSMVLSATDVDADTLSYSIATQPLNGTLSGVAPNLTYTPNADFNGADAFSFVANDGLIDSATATISLTVTAVNDAPVANTQAEISTAEDTATNVILSATDVDGDSLTYQVITQTLNGVLSGTVPNLIYTPNANYIGADSFTFAVNDGLLDSSPITVSIIVTAINDAPEANAQSITIAEDTSTSIVLSGSDIDGDTLTFSVSTQPTNGVLSGVAPNLTYTPNASMSGSDSFTYLVNDGVLDSATATVSITVLPINDAPVANAQVISTDEDVAIVLTLFGTDIDGDSLTYRVATQPLHGVLSGAAPYLTYTPDANYSGSDGFTFVANDGLLDSASATVDISLAATNDAPVAFEQFISVNKGASIALTLNATDIDNDVLTYQLYSLPKNGVLSGSAPDFIYTPNNNFSGVDEFLFTVSDGLITSEITLVDINVLSSNDAPVITSAPVTSLSELTPYVYNVEASDSNVGDKLVFSLSTAPQSMVINTVTGVVNWIPNSSQTGDQSVTVVVTDSEGLSATQSFVISVANINGAPVITSTAVTSVEEEATYVYQAQANDPDKNDVLTYSLVGTAQDLTIDSATGAMTWKPDNSFVEGVQTENTQCQIIDMPDKGTFEPVLKWKWSGGVTELDSKHVIMTPVAAQTNDDNNDGVIDDRDYSDVIFVSYSPNVLRAVSGKDGSEIFSTAYPGLETWSTPAIGDIDNDGLVEIVVVIGGGLAAFENDGTEKWNINLGVSSNGSPNIADINGDGNPEIIYGNLVLNSNGSLLWKNTQSYVGSNHHYGSQSSYAMDIDPSPGQELIAGASVTKSDGTLLWKNTAVGDGYTAVADFDKDGTPEIVVVAVDKVYLLSNTGNIIWGPVATNGYGAGAPTVSDFDGDGFLEIGVTGRSFYYVFNHDGSLLWNSAIAECCGSTGSTSFDFDGDGRNEVVVIDQAKLRIYDGATGNVLFETENITGTAYEYPIIADIDSDNHADIIVASNGVYDAGIRVYQDINNSWVPTRSIWNQNAYNISNVNDDGSIPAIPVKSWLSHNSFRLNTFTDRKVTDLADLSISDIKLTESANNISLQAQVSNRGRLATVGGISVKFYSGSPDASGTELGALSLSALAVGDTQLLQLNNINAALLDGRDIYGRIEVPSSIAECEDRNNTTRSRFIEVQSTDQSGLFDTQRFTVNVSNINGAPNITSPAITATQVGEAYQYKVTTFDQDIGEGFTYRLLSAPAGMQINEVTGLITWTVDAVFVNTTQAIEVLVTDLGGLSATQKYDLSVSERSVGLLSPGNLINRTGETVSQSLQVSNGDTATLVFTHVNLPVGLTITSEGLIQGVISAAVGEYLVDISVVDTSNGTSASIHFNWSIQPATNNPPTFTSSPVTSAVVDLPYLYQVLAIDAHGDEISYSLSSAPLGMAIDNVTGLISWTPSSSDVGDHAIRILATDGTKAAANAYTLTVSPLQANNSAPVFTSSPTAPVRVGETYYYQLSATDVDGDALSFSLSTAPTGLVLDSVNNLISWTPTAAQAGSHPVVIALTDGFYTVTQSFTLDVVNTTINNTAPIITSQPSAVATFNEVYNYALTASDADNDPLTMSLVNGPAGMTMDSSNVISWTPAITQSGVFNITVAVSDSKTTISQSFNITLVDQLLITSTPDNKAYIYEPYHYQVEVNSSQQQLITYSLTLAPQGMTISSTGMIQWVTSTGVSTQAAVGVSVTDEFGRSTEQNYVIDISLNTPPLLDNRVVWQAAVNYNYSMTLTATDADGDNLVYGVDNKPAGMVVDQNTGVINWQPTIDQLGIHSVTAWANDGHISSLIHWDILVTDVLTPISLSTGITPQFIQLNEQTTLTVAAIGGNASLQTTVTVDGVPVQLNSMKQAILTGEQLGRHTIYVEVTDGVQTQSETLYYSVGDPADVTPPVVDFNSPVNLADLTAPTDIFATVQDDNLVEVVLMYKAANEPLSANLDLLDFTEIYRGAQGFNNQAIASFDTTMLLNGTYHLLLQATDANGLTNTALTSVNVTGDLKVGNFSVTLQDLNIPLAGIPITVSRTYDSRQRNDNLDFGYGWSIDYQNVRLQESAEPTDGWTQTKSDNETFKAGIGYFNANATCINPSFGKSVTVTLPNGDTEKFNVVAKPSNGSEPSVTNPNCYLTTDRIYDISFEATAGTTSKLSTPDGYSLYLAVLDNGFLAPAGDGSAWAITNYTLTTREGFIYHLNQDFGIKQIVDPNGNTLNYSDAGITHSSGASINFNRDVNGRIDSISDASGIIYSYTYNNLGELTASTDVLSNATTYTYSQQHALEDIIDPLQRRLVRNIYDADGRMIAQEDADGVRTNFNHDVAGRVSIVTNRRGYTTQYAYDDHGNVLSETNALLQSTHYTYDADDNQLTKTNALGKVSSATYNAAGDQLTQVDELLNETTFTYNDFGQELTVTDAKGNVFTNVYDARGNLLNIADPLNNVASTTILVGDYGLPGTVTNTLGHTTTYTYDVNGFKETETDALGNVTTYVNDDKGNVLTENRSRTHNGAVVTETTTYTYDELDRLLTTTNALNETTSQEYDAVGNKLRDIDAVGRITEYTYDAYNRLSRTDYPDTSFSASTYDEEGNKLTDTDRTGYVTTYVYDELNRLVTTTYADTTSTHIEYDAVGRVSAEIDANNNRTEFEYDDAGRRVLTRDALLKETSFDYDEEGNLTSQTDANLNTTTFEYDNLDNRVKTIYPDLSESTQVYDAMGQVTSRTDQKLKTTAYAYDALGRLTEVTDALSGLTKYSYDEVGNKLTQTDAELRTTSWTYDALGREISRTLPLTQSDSSSYDIHGNLQSHTDFNGQVTSYLYDTNNRVERIDYNDLTSETFVYDFEGRRTSATDRQSNTQSWAYDNRGRLTLDTKANGDQIAYAYDNAGNRTSLTVTPFNGTAVVTAYGFDVLNRLDTVTAPGNLITGYTYDNVGNRESVTYPNGNVTTYVYDKLNRLKQQTTTQGVTVLTDFNYTLDASGHRTKITEASGRVTDYTYDDLYRLLTENVTDAVNGNYSASYVYDKVGNRTYSTVDGVQTQFTYDNNDRLTQQGGTSYTYDDNGNTLTETLDLNVKTFSYDAKNQMVGSDQAGVASIYGYDIDGLRVEKTEAAVSTSFLVDLNRDYGQVLKETNPSASVDYIYGDDLISQSRGGNLSYYLYDGLGSTRALSDVSGGVTDGYDYEAFGDTLNKTGVTENNYLFTGEQYDANLDNYYLRARYYNQNSGRFTQMDTYMGDSNEPMSLHKYLYAQASPTYYTDPSGKISLAEGVFAIGGIGLLTTLANPSMKIGGSLAGDWSNGGNGPTSKQSGWLVIAAMASQGSKLLDMLTSRVEERDDDSDDITLYHGTSSNRAQKIVTSGFRASGLDGVVYFAEDMATASSFAYTTSTPSGNTPPNSFTVITFDIPESIVKSTGLDRRYPIGSCRDVGFIDFHGGSGYERCLEGGNIMQFNGAMRTGAIKTQRIRLP